jgi:hypothetical protein
MIFGNALLLALPELRLGQAAYEASDLINVYRVFGQDAMGEGAPAIGRYWTPVNPASLENYRAAAGLPEANMGRFVIEGTVRPADVTAIRPAAPAAGNPGGMIEYFISNPSKVNIMRVSGLNPEY